jgi:hypothetical protein
MPSSASARHGATRSSHSRSRAEVAGLDVEPVDDASEALAHGRYSRFIVRTPCPGFQTSMIRNFRASSRPTVETS